MFSRLLPGTTLLAVTLVAGSMALAQTTTTPPPTPTVITLASFTEESLISADQLTSPNAPTLPDGLVSSVQNGLVDLHQVVAYDSKQSTVTVTLLSFPSGSPIPTPASISGGLVTTYTVKTKSVTATEAGIVLSGTISSASGAGGVTPGGLMAAVFAFNIQSPSVTTGMVPASFTKVNVTIAGIGSLAATSGSGALNLTGPQGTMLPIAIAGPKGQQVNTASFSLSASQSSDPNGGTLQYQWAFVPAAGQTITWQGANTVSPMVTVASGSASGNYTFQLLVTNSAGLASVDMVTVDYESGH